MGNKEISSSFSIELNGIYALILNLKAGMGKKEETRACLAFKSSKTIKQSKECNIFHDLVTFISFFACTWPLSNVFRSLSTNPQTLGNMICLEEPKTK
jgi:hypothetical protein